MGNYAGPIFITGMPRSGTKLLRDLLNGHPMISIPTIETEFLPYWASHWEIWGVSQGSYESFLKFYHNIIQLPYFIYMAEMEKLIKPDVWYHACADFNVSAVFEALVRHDANIEGRMIWGDKSPGYIRHIPLLKKIYPQAKIIHIIRDVRDYCLSTNKAWGKDMRRAAQRWIDNIIKARKDGEDIKNDYFEIRYEDLLEDTEKSLRQICLFLDIAYQPQMVCLLKPSENIGDARGISGILKQNTKKYLTKMSFPLRKKIEHISYPLLLDLGYECKVFSSVKKIGRIELIFLRVLDGINLIRLRGKSQGFLKSLYFYMNSFIQIKEK
ncbi:sulfotransferase family protein [Desulfobacula phenolica]|uniref:Sulfotransferase family protein n=1 Tax=Desulfobacula phenolica TaxID=90732 RepID=A0A1H2DU20_9BACT|nr:sulfotransferase [Desulfobacula phenolica]SDT86284.1 Sulfotransferase family protein [Desulfobacula phenolica]